MARVGLTMRPTVRIMILGGSKGHTVRATIAVGLEEGIFPRPDCDPKNSWLILYVAMTRAKEFPSCSWVRLGLRSDVGSRTFFLSGFRLYRLNQICEKCCNVAGESHWFFCGCEMSPSLHRCPSLDVIQALRPLARRLSFEGVLRCKVGNGSGRTNKVFRSKGNPVPAVIEIVAHGTRNCSSDPVKSQKRQQEITWNAPFEVAMTVTPGSPFLCDPCGQSGWRVVE